MAGGIEAIAASISADLVLRLPRQNKKQREGLALLTATMLDVRSANLMDLSASLPREAERIDMRYQYISRLLGNEHIDVDWVMAPFARAASDEFGADPELELIGLPVPDALGPVPVEEHDAEDRNAENAQPNGWSPAAPARSRRQPRRHRD